jgi:glycosyltransferase involved in cell wall biosynthesis
MIPMLFLIHCRSNTGYAIEPLEKLFYEIGLAFTENNPQHIHFGYPDISHGLSRCMPSDFKNMIEFDFKNTHSDNLDKCAGYCREHNIKYVMIFDIQPVHPLFKRLRKAGVKTIVSYYGSEMSSVMPLWKLLIKQAQVALSRSKVDGLIFESEAMAYLAVKGRGVPRRLIDIVPLGVDIDKFHPVKSDYVHQQFGFPRDRKVFFYSGHMERRKGVYVLVEAAIELLKNRGRKDVCFLFTGNTGNQSEQYEKMYEGMGIEQFIKFGGYRSDMIDLYHGSYCGVIPSSGWDSFPRTSIEMAASGLPVIASRLQGLVEAVQDKKTGLLFEPGNSKELAEQIELLLDKPSLAEQYGKAGRERCEKELNLDYQRKRFIEVLTARMNNSV